MATFRIIAACTAVHPETNGLCLVECPAEGVPHEGDHCHDEWVNGEIVGPIYWGQATAIGE